MIHVLDKEDYVHVMPLSNYYHIEIPAILTGHNSGKVFADSRTNPQTALIWTKEGSFFIGDSKNKAFNAAINPWIDATLVPMSKKLGIQWLEICSVSQEWSEKIEELFGYRGLDKSEQFVYRMHKIQEEKLDLHVLPESIELLPVSEAFFNQPFTNRKYFVDSILQFWDNLDDFCKRGFGYFLVKDNTILSRCTLDFQYKHVSTLGVSTDEKYRKCGYAKRVVSETLKHCKENGLDPYWDCMAVNKGSIALAESVGFKKDYMYSLYEFKFT